MTKVRRALPSSLLRLTFGTFCPSYNKSGVRKPDILLYQRQNMPKVRRQPTKNVRRALLFVINVRQTTKFTPDYQIYKFDLFIVRRAVLILMCALLFTKCLPIWKGNHIIQEKSCSCLPYNQGTTCQTCCFHISS